MVVGGAAGGGAVEEGEEELPHWGDAGGDYDDELFGPEGVSEWWEGGGGKGGWTNIIQMMRSTVSTGGFVSWEVGEG